MLEGLTRTAKALVRDGIGLGLAGVGLTAPRPDLFTIVTFHRVLPERYLKDYPLAPLAVTPEAFRWFLSWFSERYTCGSLDAMHTRFRGGERPRDKPFLAITFDDGQLDNFTFAKAELDRVGLKASFFVPIDAVEDNGTLWHDRLAYAAKALLAQAPDAARRAFAEVDIGLDHPDPPGAVVVAAKKLDPDRRLAWLSEVEAKVEGPTRPAWDGMMSWDQLRSAASEGHEIGSHSMSHQLLPQLRGEALRHEVAESRRVLEERLQREVRSFCYPNGDHDDAVVLAVADAGYAQAVTTAWGPNRAGQPPLKLRRCDIQSSSAQSWLGRPSANRMAWRLSPYFTVR